MAGRTLLTTLVLLQLMHLCTLAPIGKCRTEEDAPLHLHLSSYVNSTGHRVLEANLESPGGASQRLDMDVTQRKTALANGHLLALKAVTAVLDDAPAAAAEEEEEEEAEEAESVEDGSGRLPGGAVPDGDFEELHYSDYRSLGDVAFPKGLYKYHHAPQTWPLARNACAREHAHLLVPETAAEARAATRFFNAQPAAADAHRRDLFFVGLSDEGAEGHYVSVTGKNLTSLEFRSWHSKEPSKGRDQNFVAIDKDGNLHDIPNTWKLPFFCEAPAQS